MNPDFLSRVVRKQEADKSEGEATFKRRALMQFCNALQIDLREFKQPQYNSDFSFPWFHRTYQQFPFRLDAIREGIDSEDAASHMLGSGLHKLKMWNEYFDLLEQTDYEKLAVFVPITKTANKFAVMHNDWSLHWAPGYTRISHKGTDEKGIILEPIQGFVASLQKARVI